MRNKFGYVCLLGLALGFVLGYAYRSISTISSERISDSNNRYASQSSASAATQLDHRRGHTTEGDSSLLPNPKQSASPVLQVELADLSKLAEQPLNYNFELSQGFLKLAGCTEEEIGALVKEFESYRKKVFDAETASMTPLPSANPNGAMFCVDPNPGSKQAFENELKLLLSRSISAQRVETVNAFLLESLSASTAVLSDRPILYSVESGSYGSQDPYHRIRHARVNPERLKDRNRTNLEVELTFPGVKDRFSTVFTELPERYAHLIDNTK